MTAVLLRPPPSNRRNGVSNNSVSGFSDDEVFDSREGGSKTFLFLANISGGDEPQFGLLAYPEDVVTQSEN